VHSLDHVFREKASRLGDRVFIYFQDRKITYEGFARMVSAYAGLFDSLGIGKGERVALLLPNSPHYLAAWFGLARLGALLVAVNTQLRGDSLRNVLALTNPRMVLVEDRFAGAVQEISPKVAGLSIYRHLSEGDPVGRVWDGLTDREIALPGRRHIEDQACWKDPLIITFTSGTTGMPKGVVNSHHAYITAGRDLAQICRIGPEDRLYTFLPLYHANPQAYCVMGCLAAEASLVLAERFSASGFWKDVAKYGATLFSYVGAVLPILLKQPERPEEKRHTIRACFGGGAPEPIFRSAQERFGIDVLELYGMSETGTFKTINRPGKLRCGTVGTVRPGFDVRIFDDNDMEVPTGQVGEIVVRPLSPHIMFEGYFNQPEATLECYRNLWFHTGDLGRVDEEGYFTFVGRKKESIRRGGENIAPLEIEKVLDKHPAVLESAVIGIPSALMGQEIKAFVVLQKGHEISIGELVDWCRQRLAQFMVPRYWKLLPGLPKTGSQKIQKGVLSEKPFGQCWDAKLGKWVQAPED